LRRWKQEDCKLEASLDYNIRPCLRKTKKAGQQWFIPIILGTQEAEIRRIMV
jgi:hypothetical protein